LPRANTRRNICRGLYLFRRVSQAHGISRISGSDVSVLGLIAEAFESFPLVQNVMLWGILFG
jgi:hypothetical protein